MIQSMNASRSEPGFPGHPVPVSVVTVLVFLFGLVCIGLGIWFGEPGKIFEKATTVCLQCIGIG
jgi:hypothetical protein